MSNGHANCIFAVCCPPYSDGQASALAEELKTGLGWNRNQQGTKDQDTEDLALSVAAWILKNYDLAPPGSLQQFKDAIRDYAREGYSPKT